jgi:predicted GH43/DUF377 family glycosyl hydrolase
MRIDSQRLAAHKSNRHSNASIIRWHGRLLMAYRVGWTDAEIHVCELHGPDYLPGPSQKLDLPHSKAKHGREDPRFFTHLDRLYVAFSGVEGSAGPCSQFFALLRDDLSVDRVILLDYPRRDLWQKNVNFFSHDGELFAVNTISPHWILKVDARTGAAMDAHQSENLFPWSGGRLCGGAAPFRVDDEYVSFFHGKRKIAGLTTYNCGVYRFEAKPPFKVISQTPDPIAWGDRATRGNWLVANWFVCGAILEGGKWLVSGGIHDRWCEIWEYDAAHLA